MDDRENRIRAQNLRSKVYLIKRVYEILRDYLMDDEEDFCSIEMTFRKGNEIQEKCLKWERITE